MGRRRARLSGEAAGEPETPADSASAGQTEPPPERPGWRALAALATLAALARLAVLRDLVATDLYRRPQLDALEFVDWAKRILAAPLSIPSWPTHGLPYPYFLSAVFALGGSLTAARALQAVIGALTCVLLALVGARLAGRRVGLAAGTLLAIHGPLVFEDTALWEEVLLLPLLAATLLALASSRRSALAAGLGGLALGGATVVRPTVALLLPFAALWIVLLDRWPARARAAALLFAGWLALVAPIVAAVSRASGGFVFVRGFGAVNLWIGNDPAGGGAQNARLGGAWDRLENAPFRAGAKTPGEIERYFVARTIERARTDPAGLLRVVASKALWLFEREEIRDNHSFYFFRAASPVLRWLPDWSLLLALAVVGAPALDRRARRLVAGAAIALALPVLATLVGLRYRMPLVLVASLAAGAGAMRLIDRARARDGRRLASSVGLGVAVAALAAFRVHPPTHVFAEEWALSAFSLESEGRYDDARAAYERARDADRSSSLGWRGLGRLALRAGRTDEAIADLGEAVRIDPDSVDARYDFAIALAERGRSAEAIGEWKRVVELAPSHRLTDAALRRCAAEEARSGDRRAAEATLGRLVEAGRATADDERLLGRLAAARGDLAGGREHARRAAAMEPSGRESWRLLGFLAAESGDLAELRACLERLAALPGEAGAAERLLAAAEAHLSGDRERADAMLRELLARSPSPEAAALFLRNARELGREEEARAYLARLASPRPTSN